MRLVSFVHDQQATFGAVLDDGVVDLGARLKNCRTIRQLLEEDRMSDAEVLATAGADLPLADVQYLPTIPNPQKIVCVGVNYGDRNAEYKGRFGHATISQHLHAHPRVTRRASGTHIAPAGIRATRL